MSLCLCVSNGRAIVNENEIGRIIVDRAVRLHIALGPGLLETVYEVLLAHQLQEAGLKDFEAVGFLGVVAPAGCSSAGET